MALPEVTLTFKNRAKFDLSHKTLLTPDVLPRIFLASLVIAALPLAAQEPPAPDAPVPLEGPAGNAANGEGMVQNMQYPNVNVQAVLLLYQELTGNKVITDSSVQGNLSIYISTPVPKSEAIKIIEMSLIMNGFSVVPAGDGIVKVLGPGKPTRSASVPIYSQPEQIPEGEMIISYIFQLDYADPTELSNVLNQYLSTGQPYTSFLPLPKTQAILVTETTSTIRNLIGLIKEVDRPPATVVSEFIQLRRADATKVVEYLNELFQAKQQQQNQTAAGGQPNPGGGRRRVNPEEVPPPPEGVSPATVEAFLSEDNVILGKIKLTADPRTNRIHVVTRPINLPFLRQLINEFDANVDIGTPVTRPLRYISAGDVLPILVQTLKEPTIETNQSQGGGSPASGSTSGPTGGGLSGGSGGGSLSGGSEGGGGGGGGALGAEQLNTQPVDTAPEAVTIGSTRLIADKRSNSIIIMANEDVREKVVRVIDEIDVRAPQVMLHTVVGELSLAKGEQTGFSYILRNFNIGNAITGGGILRNAAESIILPGGTVINPGIGNNNGNNNNNNNGNNTNTNTFNGTASQQLARELRAIRPGLGASGLSGVITVENSLDIIVRLLSSSNRFKVTSRPLIFTSNNKKAVIASGREVAVPVSSLTSQDAGVPVTSSNIQFKPIELRLEVVPLINADNEVNLEVLQRVDSEAGSTIIDGNAVPNISTRYLRTSVTVPNRATVVLGGLITEDQSRNRGGIPILSEVPILGFLFSNTDKAAKRSELIVLIKPEVLNSHEDMIVEKAVEEQRLYLPNNLEDALTPEGVVLPERKDSSPWWKRSPKDTAVEMQEVEQTKTQVRTRKIYRN